MQVSANANPTPGTAATTSTGTATFAAALVTLGLATASWVLAVRQVDGMDMGVAMSLGSLGFFVALWVTMMAAMIRAPLRQSGDALIPSVGCARRAAVPRVASRRLDSR